jgi:ribonuclease III
MSFMPGRSRCAMNGFLAPFTETVRGALEARLGYRFHMPQWLVLALTHPSLSATARPARRNLPTSKSKRQSPTKTTQPNPPADLSLGLQLYSQWFPDDSSLHNYQRLEFLGDRVLALVVAEMLLAAFPHEKEGDIAKRHTALVQGESLAQIARKLELGNFMRLALGEEDTGGREKPSNLADVCEAIIGALYMDGGLNVASDFIRRHWQDLLDHAPTPPQDVKTILQEWALARGLALPAYVALGRSGPDHAPVFLVEVTLGQWRAQGQGNNKRQAEKAAAKALLALLPRQVKGLARP